MAGRAAPFIEQLFVVLDHGTAALSGAFEFRLQRCDANF
jgi:hypothetical protein